jgi:hypothetical protein
MYTQSGSLCTKWFPMYSLSGYVWTDGFSMYTLSGYVWTDGFSMYTPSNSLCILTITEGQSSFTPHILLQLNLCKVDE